jgi:hypothetical protein
MSLRFQKSPWRNRMANQRVSHPRATIVGLSTSCTWVFSRTVSIIVGLSHTHRKTVRTRLPDRELPDRGQRPLQGL